MKGRFLSVHLARFEDIRSAGTIDGRDRPGVLFLEVGADCRASGADPASQCALTFLVLGHHADEASAHGIVEDGRRLAPWLAEAREVWAAVLEPTRHKGEANHLDRAHPGPMYTGLTPAAPEAPLVALTSSGWNPEGLDMARVREFGAGVGGVRASMTTVDGLYSQQSFFFPGVIAIDPMTVSFWRDDAAVKAFAYGPGVHRHQMNRYHAEHHADRTSFTRAQVVRSEGTWYGKDPQRCWS